MSDLGTIVKAYDIRGRVPEELDADTCRAIGAAAADELTRDGSSAMVIGHDMRDSSPALAAALAEGVTSRGIEVVDVGLVSTDALYFASGSLALPAVMVTASHNPAGDNGLKFARAGAAPVGQDSGLATIAAGAAVELAAGPVPDGSTGAAVRRRDVLADYARHLHSLVDLREIRPLHVVVDAGNGMAGHTVPRVLDLPALTVDPMYFELDGTFPNHQANPLDHSTLVDLQARVRSTGADLGLAFDGDADRCFVVDETGAVVDPSDLTALIALRELAQAPGAAIVHNVISSRAVGELVAEAGGVPVRSRVGHSFMKTAMAEHGAVFGGEHSGHYYFRDFWRADSGMLAALHVLAALGERPAETTLSALLAPYARYTASGEINSTVADAAAVMAAVEQGLAAPGDVDVDHLDGLTVSARAGTHGPAGSWRVNLRPSNTEPLLRLNVEALDPAAMAATRDRVLAMVRGI